ncbi:MAG: ABC transporter ATP-binding protein [Erysipelotrichaceae bacterium]|jgi:ABC-2 type transport system ATP-binding protein|nr:ABC transporter ATP-binding protein [Erysipelotrichaceae bacterium]
MAEPMIEVRHLVKDYGQGRGVFDVSFAVEPGECFGFLGPNGAGKSTTIRHLMGFSIPDSGETFIRGQSSLKERDIMMQGVSYIPGEVALPLALRGSDVIAEQKKLKNVTDDTMLNWLISTFELDPSLYCKEMSLGMKRKTAIVCAFMNDPDVIVMDEPSSGLDPEMQEKFIRLIELEKKRNRTILLSSHIFQEVDACCDRITIIKDGKIVSAFQADDLKHKTTKRYRLRYDTPAHAEEARKKLLAAKEDARTSPSNACILHCTCEDQAIDRFLRSIPRLHLVDMAEKKETLEDYFMSFYKEDKTYVGV